MWISRHFKNNGSGLINAAQSLHISLHWQKGPFAGLGFREHIQQPAQGSQGQPTGFSVQQPFLVEENRSLIGIISWWKRHSHVVVKRQSQPLQVFSYHVVWLMLRCQQLSFQPLSLQRQPWGFTSHIASGWQFRGEKTVWSRDPFSHCPPRHGTLPQMVWDVLPPKWGAEWMCKGVWTWGPVMTS